jgi:molybdopterin-guanine dinucleotide biosynthesis protein A
MAFHGYVLITRILKRLVGISNEMMINASRNDQYLSWGIKVEPDIFPEGGPLGGLYTALSRASNQAVALVACDMPFDNPGLLIHQRNILLLENVDVVVPFFEKGLEPLHAIYRKDTCLLLVFDALGAGENRLISWFYHVKVRTLINIEICLFDSLSLLFLNINTPDDFARAETLAIINSSSNSDPGD